MKLIKAVEKVLEEDPRTRDNEYLWTFVIKVLYEMGYRAFIQLKKGMPSPESIIKCRRDILNNPDNKDKYKKIRGEFIPEENTTYEQPIEK